MSVEIFTQRFSTGPTHNAKFVVESALCRELVARKEITEEEADRRVNAAYRIGALAQLRGEPFVLTPNEVVLLDNLDHHILPQSTSTPQPER